MRTHAKSAKAKTKRPAVAAPVVRNTVLGARDTAEAIVETISESVLVLDGELRVLAMNTSFRQAFGISSREIVGKPVFELGDGQWDIPRLRQLLTELLRVNTPLENAALEHDFPALGHRHLLLNARLIQRAGGATGMVVLAIRDVTAMAEATRAGEESEATKRAFLETASQGILAIDRSGTIRLANRMMEGMFAYDPGELLGKSMEILLPERFHDGHRIRRTEFFSAPPPHPMEVGLDLVGRRKDGTEFPVEVRLSHLEAKDARVAVCFVSDIKVRKEHETATLLYQQELQALSARLLSAQETSSKHLARELHDVLSQKLAVLGMEVSSIETRAPASPKELGSRLHAVGERISELAKDIHQISRRLHPAILDDLGLAAALNNECLAFSGQYGLRVEFAAREAGGRLPEDVSLCLYRVAQESLRNIGSHAGASEVFVELTVSNEEAKLTVEDSGDGFEPEEARGKGGLGLVSMDERVRLVNGTFSLRSKPGEGTRVEVRVPLRGEEA